MTTDRSRHSERTSDPAIRAFFDQWHVYELIIGNDYMGHRGIHRTLGTSLASRRSPFSVVDLGCGDGSVVARTLRGLPVKEYIGVDLSSVALEEARKSFSSAPFEVRLVQSSLSDYLRLPATDEIDVVIAGFALHHLPDNEKERFFFDCRSKIRDDGDLFVYDVFRQEGQTRDDYLTTYCDPIKNDWTALSVEQRESVCEHIRTYDFPVSFGELCAFARAAGFDVPTEPTFVDDAGNHRLCRFGFGARG